MLLVLVNSINMFAQSSMKEAVDMTEVFDLPYKRTKLGGTGFGCMIDNSRNVVPNKLYTNSIFRPNLSECTRPNIQNYI